MADNITTTSDELNDISRSAEITSIKIDQVAKSFEGINLIADHASKAFNNLILNIGGMGKVLNGTEKITDNQTVAFSALTLAMLNTSKTFDEASFDVKGLNTFEGQITDIVKTLSESASPLSKLLAFSEKIFNKKITGDAKETVGAAKEYIISLARGADNALRMQNALFKMSAATGSLNQVLTQSGDNLHNINNVLAQHQNSLNATAEATQVPIEAIRDYYMQLGKVPGAFTETINGADKTKGSVNMLTATMQYAAGSGRNFTEVVEDLQHAFVNYDMVGQDALNFTARMGEISNKYNVQLNIVRDSIRNTAAELKMFGHEGNDTSKMMEGATRIMNNYVGALKSTGISGATAVDVITNMTKHISTLDIATRSFVSSQTGGAGGLRGAFQIEKMIKEGDIDKVMEKVRETMTKQFGKIVSIEEAAQSESAAAMLTKQRLMLQQGPLKQFARSEQEAGRILESFKAKEDGVVSPLKDNILKDTMTIGVNFQEQSATHLGAIRAVVEGQKGLAGITMRGYIGQGLAARPSDDRFGADETEAEANARNVIISGMNEGALAGGSSAEKLGIKDLMTEATAAAWDSQIEKMRNSLGEIPKAFKDFAIKIKNDLISGEIDDTAAVAAVQREIKAKKEKGVTEVDLAKMNSPMPLDGNSNAAPWLDRHMSKQNVTDPLAEAAIGAPKAVISAAAKAKTEESGEKADKIALVVDPAVLEIIVKDKDGKHVGAHAVTINSAIRKV